MVWKVTAQKESLKESLPKATSEVAVCRCSSKQVLLEISQYSQKKHLCLSLFLIKLQALQLATLFKRDFSTGVFL